MIRTVTDAGVASLTLDRPDRGNALSAALVEALIDAVEQACADRSVHTIALAGAGRHLCTGLDLSDLETTSDGDLLARLVRIETLLARLWHAPVHTVAVASGRTWGAGADLFAACDLRLAERGTTFRFPGAGFGIVLGTRRLAERVGPDRARRWVSGGVEVDAEHAHACGLASALVDAPAAGSPGGAAPGVRHRHAPIGPAPTVDRDTLAALCRATRADHRDADLAALVRSAARPGLKARIAAYRDHVRNGPGAAPVAARVPDASLAPGAPHTPG